MSFPNPVLKKLGFADDARVVILHMDDVGMCHASVEAYRQLLDFGLMSSAAVMVPCPWFMAATEICRQYPHADMGVHLTINSEWHNFRWSPISTADTASGMIDAEGYFYDNTKAVRENGNVHAVATELHAQIQRALAAGVDATHVDAHMGALLHSRFLGIYVQAAQQHHVPAMMFRFSAEQMLQEGMDEAGVNVGLAAIEHLENQGVPLLDAIVGMPLDKAFGDDRMDLTKQLLSDLKPGITHFLFHAAIDTPELRALAPDWQARVGDLRVFSSPELRDFIQQQGIHIIGYRQLRDVLRGE